MTPTPYRFTAGQHVTAPGLTGTVIATPHPYTAVVRRARDNQPIITTTTDLELTDAQPPLPPTPERTADPQG